MIIMNYTILSNIIKLCTQYYKPDTFQHCLRVAKYAASNPAISNDDEREVIYKMALCHDLIEDTSCTYEEIAEASISSIDYIKNVLGLLTRQSSESYEEYICRLRSSKNKHAYIIKLCDIKDHLEQKETLTDSLKKRYLSILPTLL